ncbi:hypothetical protein TcG_08861, partial [Trypanosoma cruzi]
TITHEDVAQSGRSFCGCVMWMRLRAYLSARWPQRVAATLFSREICYDVFTCVLLRGQCAGGCAIAGWRKRSGGKCVSAAVKGRAGCLAAEGISRPGQHRSCRAPSITLQHLSRRHQHAASQRTPPPPQVRPEWDTIAVVFRGGTSCGTVACSQTPRGVRTRHRALAAECLRVAVAAPNFLSTCMLVRVKGNVHVRIYPCGVCAVTAVPHGYGTVA